MTQITPGAPPPMSPPLGLPDISAPQTSPEPSPRAPEFAEAEPLKLSKEERKDITETISELHRSAIEARQGWLKRHQDYDLMHRGQMNLRDPESGPWPNSSNLHIQMPFWLVDAYNTRLVTGIWGQTPLVIGQPVEDDDQEIARNAAGLVQWHFEPKRMNARAAWGRISKTRCIHGRGVGIIPWARDEYIYRIAGDPQYKIDDDGRIIYDQDGTPSELEDSRESILKRQTRYDGPLLVPLEWDDILEPMEGTNLQAVSPSNPLGADWVGIRQWEPLSLIWKKRSSAYSYIEDDDELKDKTKDWIDHAPSQDRSGSGAGSASNQTRVRLQDFIEGRNRSESQRARSPRARPNPEFEILTWMMPWELPNEDGEKEEAECVFFFRVEPQALIGAFRLSDLQWRNRRPLLELDFHTVGTRRLSMGIMEIVEHLSAELDTIHNMRIDVGFATNIPFFFYRATSTTRPDQIHLKPGTGIPIDDIRAVHFPQLQSVTSFYHQEEQLLYSLVERVLGITDLFLGISPTQGAAARHATGFVGTQQESLARTQEVLTADATAFSHLCHMVYEAEVQFGPDERILRLQGREGPLTQALTRDQLWFRGEYDFTLGANHGLYSNMLRQQQAQILMQTAGQSPLVNADPGRRWEVENFVYHAFGFPNPELFIGPKSGVSAGSPTAPDEENGEMDQMIHGSGIPAPVHPSDNDQDHLRRHQAHLSGPDYEAMGRPNEAGHISHIESHLTSIQRKEQMQAMAMMNGMGGGGGGGQAEQPSPQPNARNVASLEGVESAGAMGDINQRPGKMSQGGAPPFNSPTNGQPR